MCTVYTCVFIYHASAGLQLKRPYGGLALALEAADSSPVYTRDVGGQVCDLYQHVSVLACCVCCC